MCIYFGDQDNLTYVGEEHIFPAAIGGMCTLEKGCVSDQANSIFDKLENEFTHASTVWLCRAFSGPGKRGSKKPSGTVRVFNYSKNNKPEKLSFGILSMGKIYHIPQIIITHDSFSFTDECSSDNELMKSYHKFISKLSDFNKDSRFTNITPDDYSEDTILIGFYNRRWYVVCSDIEKLYSRIEVAIKSKESIGGISHNTFQASLNDKIQESEVSDRVYAKIAFNVLCKLNGTDFVSSKSFDKFKQWVVTGEPINDNWTNEHVCQASELAISFPEESHWCLISCNQNQVCAIVCLYNRLMRKFIIGEMPKGYSIHKLDGYICDWKNHIEYKFNDYINKIIT